MISNRKTSRRRNDFLFYRWFRRSIGSRVDLDGRCDTVCVRSSLGQIKYFFITNTKEIVLKLYEVSEASDINVIDDKTTDHQSSFPCSKICIVFLAVFTILSAVGIFIVLKLYFGNKFGDRFKVYMPAEWFHNLISLKKSLGK